MAIKLAILGGGIILTLLTKTLLWVLMHLFLACVLLQIMHVLTFREKLTHLLWFFKPSSPVLKNACHGMRFMGDL